MKMVYVKVWLDWHEITKKLKDAEKGRLIDAIVAYAKGDDPEVYLTGNEQFVFPHYQSKVDQDRAELEGLSRTRSEAGQKGGRPKKANASDEKQKNQMLSEESKKSKAYSIKHIAQSTEPKAYTGDNGASPQTRARKAFVPPTPSDVRAYCLEHGYAVDAERFCDYYAQQGWKLSNGLPLKDWQACVRTWARRDQERGVQARPQSSDNIFADMVREGVFEDEKA